MYKINKTKLGIIIEKQWSNMSMALQPPQYPYFYLKASTGPCTVVELQFSEVI